MKRIVLTGATGFLGRHLLQYFSGKSDVNLRCIVRRSSLHKLDTSLDIDVCQGDITDKESLSKAFSGADVLIHCAGFVGKGRDMLWKINVEGTKNCFQCALEQGVGRVIYISSISVISGNPGILKEDMPLKSSNIYGQSKLEAEKIAWDFVKKGMRVVILRPAMVYGRGEPHLLPVLIKLLKKRMFPLLGRAENRWHLCAVENFVRAVEVALLNEEMEGQSFIVADEEVLSVREVIERLVKAVNAPTPLSIPEGFIPILKILPISVVRKFVSFFTKDRVYDISKLKYYGWHQIVSPYSAIESL